MRHDADLRSRNPSPSKPPPLPIEPKLVLPPKLTSGPAASDDLRHVLAWSFASLIAVLILISAIMLFVLPLKSEVAKKDAIRTSPNFIQPTSTDSIEDPFDEKPSEEDSSTPKTKSAEDKLSRMPVAPDAPSEAVSPPPISGNTSPKQSVANTSFWPIAPSFPREPAMNDGKPVGDTPAEVLSLPNGSEVTQLELTGAPRAKSDGNLPAFRLVSSGSDTHSWSIQGQR